MSDTFREQIAAEARDFVGSQYAPGANACANFVCTVLGDAGVDMTGRPTNNAAALYNDSIGPSITSAEVKSGDLVFFKGINNATGDEINYVGVLDIESNGNQYVIHKGVDGAPVERTLITGRANVESKIVGYRRVNDSPITNPTSLIGTVGLDRASAIAQDRANNKAAYTLRETYNYTIKPGDSIREIARVAGVTPEEVIGANPSLKQLSVKDWLGLTLKIPFAIAKPPGSSGGDGSSPLDNFPPVTINEGAMKDVVNIPYRNAEGDGVRANVRFNNPGAAYPRPGDIPFGLEGYDIIGGGHLIGKFPTPIHGAAANMDLFLKSYTGLTIRAAIDKWRGRGGTPVPAGFKGDTVLTEKFVTDRETMINFFGRMADHESGEDYNIPDDYWGAAFDMYTAGGDVEYRAILEKQKKEAEARKAQEALRSRQSPIERLRRDAERFSRDRLAQAEAFERNAFEGQPPPVDNDSLFRNATIFNFHGAGMTVDGTDHQNRWRIDTDHSFMELNDNAKLFTEGRLSTAAGDIDTTAINSMNISSENMNSTVRGDRASRLGSLDYDKFGKAQEALIPLGTANSSFDLQVTGGPVLGAGLITGNHQPAPESGHLANPNTDGGDYPAFIIQGDPAGALGAEPPTEFPEFSPPPTGGDGTGMSILRPFNPEFGPDGFTPIPATPWEDLPVSPGFEDNLDRELGGVRGK